MGRHDLIIATHVKYLVPDILANSLINDNFNNSHDI